MQVVANCHGMPQNLFERRMVSVEECVSALETSIVAWTKVRLSFKITQTIFAAAPSCEKHPSWPGPWSGSLSISLTPSWLPLLLV